MRVGHAGEREVREGDVITLDGSTGEVMLGAVPTVQPELAGDFGTLMEWADAVRVLKVRTNAETPADCRVAREFGAEGIGLCRTEHMFFDAARITAVRQMILAEDEAGRRAALEKLLPEQRSGLRRDLRGDGRAAVHDPPARPAAPRIPAARGCRVRGGRQGHRDRRRHAEAPRRRTARIQPDARPSRLPARRDLSRNLRDAGARDLRGRLRCRQAHRRRRRSPK